MTHIIIPKPAYTDEKPLFKCDHGDCKYSTSKPSNLRTHKRTHTRKKTHTCYYKGCGLKFSTSSEFEAHKIVVHNIIIRKKAICKKTIECEICGLIFSQYGKYFRHKCKQFKCDYKKCKYKTSRPDELVRHKKKHTEKLYICEYEGCESHFLTIGGLTVHKRTHTGEKPFACKHEGCGSKFAQVGNLIKHMNTHTGYKPFACEYKGCESRFSRQHHLKKHKETHTITGQIRRRPQENHLTKKLKEWGFSVDAETTINAKRGTCLIDTDRYYSRIDYHVINCTSAILLLECDEDQHTWYELSCEFSRMADVRASLLTAGYELPVYWIRYNPIGNYYIGGKNVKITREKREIALKAKIEELCSTGFVPDKQENIHYMFYELISEEAGPVVMGKSDFPEYLKQCVTWH